MRMFVFSLFILSLLIPHWIFFKESHNGSQIHIASNECTNNNSKIEMLPACSGFASAALAAEETTKFFTQNISSVTAKLSNNNTNTSPASLYDDFENQGTYTLSDGQTSPNGKWKVAYTGFGSVGVQQDANTGNHYFFEQPKTSTLTKDTYASMALTTKQYSDFEMDLDMKTVAQLRQNSPPNTWETAWVFWHYTDEFHYYALTLKTNGLQIEKKDNTNHDDSAEIYLVDTSSQTVKLGQWQHIKIRHEGSTTPHIQVWVDGVKAADFVDNQPVSSSTLSSGYMGLYNEDAKANFDNVNINALTSQ